MTTARLPALFRMAVIGLAAIIAALAATRADAGAISIADPHDEAALRRMIGQLILVGFSGNHAGREGFRHISKQAREGKITGVIYLGRNIRSLDDVRHMNEALQQSLASPAFIALDQEGGRIQRLTRAVGFEEVPSAAAIATDMTPAEAEKRYGAMAGALAGLGFNLNLGPVVDLNINPANPIIGALRRSYSSDPQTVTAYATAFVRAHRSHGVATALKHFPGHGSAAKDSHKGSVDVTSSWRSEELIPYRSMIADGDADIIMSAHVTNDTLASEPRMPASLSPSLLTGLLRGELDFYGVVLTDDLQMRAILDRFDLREVTLRALMAGNDVLMFANDKVVDPYIPEKIADLLVEKAAEDPKVLARIREASSNVARLKKKLSAQRFEASVGGTKLP